MPKSVFDLYSYSEYKPALKDRLQFLRKKKPALSWRQIADQIPMQSTYLSKVLNDQKSHFSEDDLFRICQWLEFRPDEVEFILLLRGLNSTQEKSRREFLSKKIQDICKKRVVSADYVENQAQSMGFEMNYLLDPTTVLIHGALYINKYKTDPLQLCSQLGITQTTLKNSLQILNKCNYITLGKSPFQIEKLQSVSPHFGRQHPLTRIHQMAMKSMMMSRLNQTPEENKESFVVTFTMEEGGFEKVKEAFHEFVKKTREISKPSRHDKLYKLYQLNFDLLEWF